MERQNGISDQSLAELLRQLSEQSSRLAHQEVELAKAEMNIKAKRLGAGVGAFGAAGLLGLFALGALTAAAILALAIVLDAWLAALVVAAVYGLVAGILALTGRKEVRAGSPPAPERAIESTKRDIEEAKRSAKTAREGAAR
ncbi:MAG TPA: phage holin family protein [Solirubrobacterales bacterium]|nr:phage holin family protein [Solirubrobacterales bacterium]